MYGERGLDTWNIERQQRESDYLSSTVKALLPKAEQLAQASTPDTNSFSQYSAKEREEDACWAAAMKRKFARENSVENAVQFQYATVMEAILLQHGELSEWFGEGVFTVKTTDFDDLRNGLDLILSFPSKADANERQHLGIDVTFSQFKLAKKLSRGYDEVCNGELATVKYYACEDTGERGAIQVPRITLAITREHVTELAGLWMNNKNQELGNHAVKEIFLKEMEAQLLYFMGGAVKHNQLALRDRLQDLRQIIIRTHAKGRNGIKRTSFSDMRDSVADSLVKQCE